MTRYYEVDVKNIVSSHQRSEFETEALEKLAKQILNTGKLLRPLTLKQTGPESYEVMSGHFEYYAAVRAKEIDLEAGETVSAFVIPIKQQDSANQQVKILEQGSEIDQLGKDNTAVDDRRITNLESRVDKAIQEIKNFQAREIEKLEIEIRNLRDQIPKKIEPLDAFNKLSIPELTYKLSAANFKGKRAATVIAIIEKERKKRPFISFTDIIQRVKGLGDKTMLSIIDAWSGNH